MNGSKGRGQPVRQSDGRMRCAHLLSVHPIDRWMQTYVPFVVVVVARCMMRTRGGETDGRMDDDVCVRGGKGPASDSPPDSGWLRLAPVLGLWMQARSMSHRRGHHQCASYVGLMHSKPWQQQQQQASVADERDDDASSESVEEGAHNA